MGAYPIRFRTQPQLKAAGLPVCACGHPAWLHGLLEQHVGGSGCFRTWWKPGASPPIFQGTCRCPSYRPGGPMPAGVTTLPGVIVAPGYTEEES